IRDRNVTGVQTCALPILIPIAMPIAASIVNAIEISIDAAIGIAIGIMIANVPYDVPVVKAMMEPKTNSNTGITAGDVVCSAKSKIGRASCRVRGEEEELA